MRQINIISADEAKDMLNNKEAILIDVREPVEHQEEYIEGAHLIPLGEVDISKINADGRKIIIHCKAGKRGLEACQKLLNQNPELEIYNLENGINGWVSCGYETCKSDTISLQRQVMIVAGTITLFGVITGYTYSKFCFLISGFVGAGLTYAGISGNCYMAMLLAKMPWNKK